MFVIRVIAALLGFVGLCLGSASASAAVAPSHADVHVVTGTLADGAAYVIRMPHHWTGTLALYGHGLVFPGDWNPAVDSPDELVADFLLDRGVAVAGSSYASAGWAAPDGIADQLATLDQVVHRFGRPARTIAWGQSLGGAIATALVERRSDVVDAALPMCNFGAGSEGLWNHYLDSAFVAKTLLAPHSDLRLTGITDPVANIDRAQQILGGATGTPSGRARLALAAAVAQLPGALRPDLPPPAGVEGRLEARLGWLQAPYLPLAFGVRADVEARAGGNPSTNVGVDYRHELALSGQRADVEALYARAGLSLGADLNRLAAAPRVHADARARAYLQDNVSFTGSLSRPV